MKRKKLTDILSKGDVLVSDGAWGTLLQQNGLKAGECPELMSIERSDVVYSVAQEYINAGSDMIETNSFGGSAFKLEYYGLREKVEEINRKAAELSRKAAGESKWVIGSMGPTGKMLVVGDVTEEQLYEAFKQQAIALEKGGADGVIVETMSDVNEAALAVRAVRENTQLTIIASFTFEHTVQDEFRTMMGISPTQAAERALAEGAHIIGTNCGNGYEGLERVIREMADVSKNIPKLIQPNAGIPQNINGVDVFQATPEEMAEKVPLWVEAGAQIIGGCCGTNPEHIRAIREAVDNL